MDSPFFLFLVVFLYVVVFGGLSLLRREGLSMRFALEAIGLTTVVSLLAWALGVTVHPVIFLFFLYLITMRVRMLVDLGNALARRKNFSAAEKVYQFAGKVWPDSSNRLILEVNQSTSLLQQGALDEAIQAFKTLLTQSNQGYLGIRYESAAHYNLGIAYLRKGLESQAVIEFNTVLDIWPASEYARAASNALARLQKKKSS
jgi:tetratricopeptide (TPR) repeat protein